MENENISEHHPCPGTTASDSFAEVAASPTCNM